MDSFYEDEKGEIHYYTLRDRKGPDTIFISKVKEFPNSLTGETKKVRYIRKVFDREDTSEIVNVKGELVLRCSASGRDQIKVIVYGNSTESMGFTLQKFRGDTGNPYKETGFSFYQGEFKEFLEFLYLVRFIDLSDTGNFQVQLSDLKSKVLVNRSDRDLIEAFRNIHGEERLRLLERIKKENLTKEDLDILSGRKEGLESFREHLFDKVDWREKDWQAFFQNNTWIFGYGLDYRFLSILQREAAVSDQSVDRSDTVTADFLLGSSNFTVLVELKRPDTPLFDDNKNRSGSWCLSKDIIHSVSQILEQKASWQVKGDQRSYTDSGEELIQKAYDPKSILVIGRLATVSGTQKEKEIKLKTLELFRRDSRNIEILTYDELFERANFIVNQK